MRVIVTGSCPGLEGVVRALAASDDVELVTSWDEALRAGVDVVVFGVDVPSLPPASMAWIREHTPAPIVLVAPEERAALLDDRQAHLMADAVLLPEPDEGILFAVRKAAGSRSAAGPQRARVLTVFSPKGGTGKTVTATNLATSLAQHEGRRVLLVDLDLQFGDCAIMLGLEPRQTIMDLVGAPGEFDPEKLAGYVTAHASGLELLAAPRAPQEAELVPAARLGQALDVAAEAYDVVVIDTAPFLYGPVLAALDRTDDLLLIAALEVPTLKDIRQSLETLDLISYPREKISMVVNRADTRTGISIAEVEDAFGLRVAWQFPTDPGLVAAINRGQPIVTLDPHAPFAGAVRELAAATANRPASVVSRAVPVAS